MPKNKIVSFFWVLDTPCGYELDEYYYKQLLLGCIYRHNRGEPLFRRLQEFSLPSFLSDLGGVTIHKVHVFSDKNENQKGS